MSKNVDQTSSRKAMANALAVAALMACATFTLAFTGIQLAKLESEKHRSPPIENVLELNLEWQNANAEMRQSGVWPVDKSYVPRKTFELLHPLTWATIVLISVMATSIWASNEWEIDRLFELDSRET